MEIASNLFECEFTRLSDIMIPLKTFSEQVELIEGIGEYHISLKKLINGKYVDVTDSVYTAPYPFTVPVQPQLAEYCKEHSINTLAECVHDEWKREIDFRATPFCETALDEKVIQQIDDTPYLGAIVHLMSGYIVTVDYRYLTDIQIGIFPNSFNKLKPLLDHCRPMTVAGDARGEIELAAGVQQIASDDWYVKFYFPEYHLEDGSVSTDLITGTFKTTNLLSFNHTQVVSSEILAKLQQRKRIILTP